MMIHASYGRNFTSELSRVMMSISAPIIRAMTRSENRNDMSSG